MSVKLELYRVFKEVAEAGNITAAAQALYISQSAVSQSIKQLEGELQTRLFARNSRGVALTPDGRMLYEYVRSAIGLLETGEEKLSQSRELQMGHLTIGASDTVTSQFLLPYLDSCIAFARRAAQAGKRCALRLWNGGGLDRRNEEILSFLSEKLGRDVTALPTDRLGNRRLGEGLFLEPGERFDWPDPAAPDSGTEFCHGLRSQIAVLCDGTVVPCCLDSEGRLALGNLHRQELAEILASPRATAMATGFSRRQPSEELCRRCGYAARFSR